MRSIKATRCKPRISRTDHTETKYTVTTTNKKTLPGMQLIVSNVTDDAMMPSESGTRYTTYQHHLSFACHVANRYTACDTNRRTQATHKQTCRYQRKCHILCWYQLPAAHYMVPCPNKEARTRPHHRRRCTTYDEWHDPFRNNMLFDF